MNCLSPKGSVVLSFDVEEHYRIEVARGMDVPETLREDYDQRMLHATELLLNLLHEYETHATFFIVGEIAEKYPALIKNIVQRGHEIASHSQHHQRVNSMNEQQFREDLHQSLKALQAAGQSQVLGFRAPTFSIDAQTPWAVNVMTELGLSYDSSVFPVVHDRYGIPEAPRTPFYLRSNSTSILELPPLTRRFLGKNIPVAGGGYFRLFPLAFMHSGIKQMLQASQPAILYFHPWEFDPQQPRLPLKKLTRWRTYVGMNKTVSRLKKILDRYRGTFTRMIDLASQIHQTEATTLPCYHLDDKC